MLSATTKNIIEKAERTHRIIWLVLTISLSLWLLVGFLMSLRKEPYSPHPFLVMHNYLLYITALIISILSIGMRYYVFTKQRIALQIRKKPDLEKFVKDHQTGKIDIPLLEDLEKLSKYEQGLVCITNWTLKHFIVIWSLNNIISFVGLLVLITLKSFTSAIPFTAIALFLNIITFPKLQKLIINEEIDEAN